MRYPYICEDCHETFDVFKSLAAIDYVEICFNCGSDHTYRTIAPVNLMDVGEWAPSFNPAFGKVVKSKKHQREILAEFRDKGVELEELGNENPDNTHEYFERQREEAHAKSWADADKDLQEIL